MTQSAITPTAQSLTVTEVAKIEVADVSNMGDGTFARRILIYGQPAGAAGDPVLALTVVGPSQDAIEIPTPTLAF